MKKLLDPVIFCFGRMNPPTLGHSVVWDKMEDLAEENDCLAYICLSHTEDKKNVIPYEDKVKIVKDYVESMSYALTSVEDLGSNAYQIIGNLKNQGIKKAIFVVGSDRVDDFKDLEDASGINVEVVCAGQRKENGTSKEAASSTKMKEYAKNGQFNFFRQMCPDGGKDLQMAKKLYDLTRSSFQTEA